MRCPFCGHMESQVKDSRPSEDGAAIRRRRNCPECGGRFTTFERVQLRELTILKRSGRRTPFDRDKLVNSLSIALRKRPVDAERVAGWLARIALVYRWAPDPNIRMDDPAAVRAFVRHLVLPFLQEVSA